MKTIITAKGQSLIDIALQMCGNADYAVDIATENGLTLDSICSGGEILTVPDGNARAAAAIEEGGIVPCSGGNDLAPWNGIGTAMVGELTI